MTDVKSLLDTVRGDDKAKGWDAVKALVYMRPSTEEESKARAFACCCMAEAMFARQKIGTAIDWWQEAVDCDPLNPIYRLGFVARGLLTVGLNNQALNEVERAIRLDDENPDAFRLLGNVQLALHNTSAAADAFDREIELAPDNPYSYLDRTDLALELSDWKTVERHTAHVLEMNRGQIGNALHQQGLMAYRQGRHEDALKIWDETLNHECDNREVVSWNQSVALLSLGQFRAGWAKHEARGTQVRDLAQAIHMHRGMSDRLFNNEPAPARLHVHQEMGFGDAICMARYLPLLVERGYEVHYEVMDSLVELMKQSLPGVKVMGRAPIYPGLLGVPEFDYLVPILSLPRLFGTVVETVPWRGPFLKANPEKVERYRKKLHGRPAVGLCWSAGIRTDYGVWLNEYGKRKSVSLDAMLPIIDALDDYVVVSLQVGPERKDSGILDLLPDKPTWADTAALIECLDLVITVDTGLAHLVGGMGKPLWLMMHTEGSWHWMAERPGASWNEASPWYPSARLFRAKQPHQWDDVIRRIASELTQQKSGRGKAA